MIGPARPTGRAVAVSGSGCDTRFARLKIKNLTD
jgi:hypothetical protein